MKKLRCLTIRWPMRAIALASAVTSMSCATAPAMASAAQGAAAVLPAAWSARGDEPGNEPLWRLDHADRWRLSMIDLKIEGPASAPRIDGGCRIYEGRIEGRALRATLTPRLCRDTMTGMPHPRTAQLRLDGRTLDGCAGEPGTLLVGRWRVIAVDGVLWPVQEGLLAFDADGRLGANTGCNSFSSRWTLSGEGLAVPAGALTRKACPPPIGAAEQSLLAVLREAMRFDIADDGALLLHATSGRSLRAKRVP